ncbi:MAG: transporter substrate-binding domain-containing protein [Erysipelotrichia bacterium]|nr:transporter substrate-binding domain-containing protein [Erysipelotrichia bacterium]
MQKITVCAVSAMMLLAGCGSSAAAGTAESVSTSSASAAAFKVGMECNYAPFNWTTVTAGDTTQKISEVDYCDGYDVVIAEQIAAALGTDVQIVKTDWDNLIPALQNGEIDAIIAGMTDTAKREESVSFTTPYYTSQEVVIVRKDSELTNITDIQELSGKKVLGQLNTLYDSVIDQINGVIHATPLESMPATVNALQHGEVDAVVSELPVAEGIVAANPDLAYVTFQDGHGFVADSSVSIAIAKDNKDLLNKVQAALDAISEDQRQALMAEAVVRQPAANE